MMALPKARSQGSNGAGGGAFTALTGISAARAEPEIIASAVANNTIFFMRIPITFLRSAPATGAPQGQAKPDCIEFGKTNDNLELGAIPEKQKRQASADFLGGLPVSRKVVGVCCIPTTILGGCALHWSASADNCRRAKRPRRYPSPNQPTSGAEQAATPTELNLQPS